MRIHSNATLSAATQLGVVRTLAPFLYQTRTLSPVRYFPRTASQFLHSTPPRSRRDRSASTIAARRAEIPIHRINVRREPRSKVGDNEEEKRLTPIRERGIPFDEGEDFDGMILSDDSDAFLDEEIVNDSLEKPDTSTETTAGPGRESTITADERDAFERIFADIVSRTKSAGDEEAPFLDLSNEQGIMTEEFGQRRTAKESFRSVMKRTQASASLPITKTQEELKADLDRYPMPLRAAAAKALGLFPSKSTESSEDDTISTTDDIKSIRLPEQERVEGLMRDAKTDIELWHVMETEVFALVGKLGLGEKPKIPAEVTKPRARKKKTQASKVAKDEGAPIEGGEQPLDIGTYGPLYPAYILLGLRLLDRSFARSSPLVLNILPRIKSLGIVSHVLGASTAFYNELLRIRWTRYDDFIGVSKVLNEMEQAGLEFDEESLSIVSEIILAQQKVRRGDRGPALQALWTMPEFAPGKFRVWKEKIQTFVDERGTAIPYEVAREA